VDGVYDSARPRTANARRYEEVSFASVRGARVADAAAISSVWTTGCDGRLRPADRGHIGRVIAGEKIGTR